MLEEPVRCSPRLIAAALGVLSLAGCNDGFRDELESKPIIDLARDLATYDSIRGSAGFAYDGCRSPSCKL